MSEWIVSAENIEDLKNGIFTIMGELIQCEDCKYCNGMFCRNQYTYGTQIEPDGYCNRGVKDDK